jgi:hypothetical protein
MTATSKLVSALTAGAFAVRLTGAASAQRLAPNSNTRNSPPALPTQIMPAGIYPLTPEREQTLKPKDSFKECAVCPEMVVIPPGSCHYGHTCYRG